MYGFCTFFAQFFQILFEIFALFRSQFAIISLFSCKEIQVLIIIHSTKKSCLFAIAKMDSYSISRASDIGLSRQSNKSVWQRCSYTVAASVR